MAILVPHRPRYRNRTQPIYYLLGERACLRSRPKQGHDSKMPAQLLQRLCVRVASHFLAQFRTIVELGYALECQENSPAGGRLPACARSADPHRPGALCRWCGHRHRLGAAVRGAGQPPALLLACSIWIATEVLRVFHVAAVSLSLLAVKRG